MSRGRIDVHHHVVPPDYAAALRARGVRPGGVEVPRWSATSALKVMRRNGIESAVLSLSTPGVWVDAATTRDEARSWARRVNEYAAAQCSEHPGRFGFFATVTLPDVEGAVAEATYAFDHLGADGVAVLANSRGTYLHDEAFAPLLRLLDERAAVVFVHPGELPAEPVPGVPAFTADFLLDTTRAATGLLLSGALERYPNIRWILAHAGGFLPYISYRVLLTMLRQEGRRAQLHAMLRRRTEVPRRLDLLRRFYVDTAISATPASLPTLLSSWDTGRILHGSDSPFMPAPAVRFINREYAAVRMPRSVRQGIDRGNAETLLPRFAR